MKKLIILFLLIIGLQAQAQIERFSGGLGFSSGVDYNYSTSGNPAVFGKAYLELSKRLNIIPGLAVYNKGEKGSSFTDDIRKNYMFQADLDAQYGLLREDQITLVGFAGFNMTGVVSRVIGENTTLENNSAVKPGVNLGIAVEMKINNFYDAVISGKYIVSEFDQFVINIGVMYHLSGRRSRGRW